jgi:cytoskeletal protein RodZ
MNPQTLLSALPWARRAWKMMPPALRVPALLVVAGLGVWYAMQGREQQRAQTSWEPPAPES